MAGPPWRAGHHRPQPACPRLDLACIDSLPSWGWYQDVAGFAEGITGEHTGRRLAQAIRGSGAFRRFKEGLHEEYPGLLPRARALCRSSAGRGTGTPMYCW